jgi:predicted Zn-dependent protease with MMP-like domain
MFPHVFDNNWLLVFVVALALFAGLFWRWNIGTKNRLGETGRVELPPIRFDRLADERQPRPQAPLKYSEQEFQEMVAEALDELPEEFDKEWKNIAVIVSTDWASEADKEKMGVPKGNTLLGSYSGVDRTRGLWTDSSTHVIVVYQPALELRCGSDKALLEGEIRRVVLHELGHYLGMSHGKMKEIGL